LQLVILVIVANPVIIAHKSAVLALWARQHGAARHCELRQNLEHLVVSGCCVSIRVAVQIFFVNEFPFLAKKREKQKFANWERKVEKPV
jgi:hypothetical protein